MADMYGGSTAAASAPGWQNTEKNTGIWEHRGKVAFAGYGVSEVNRRWDGVSMDKTLGALAIQAATKALEDAGLTPADVDGLFACPDNMAGADSGPSASWGPTRPYFEPPYDSEDGLTIVTPKWLLANWPALSNVAYAPDGVPNIGQGLGMTAQAVAEGRAKVGLYLYTGNNLEGRYRTGGAMVKASGNNQWTNPWGANIIDLQMGSTPVLRQYFREYGGDWDETLGKIIVNERRNGLLNDWGIYSTTRANEAEFTMEDYTNGRYITWPSRIWDFDMPVHAVSAFVITTAERARDLRHKPVYILSHTEATTPVQHSSQWTLQEYTEALDYVAKTVYAHAGMKPAELDIFNPYDGFATFLPMILDAFGWHGVGRGETPDFVKENDISVEGPHPLFSGGGNLGSGRTRSAMYIDSIDQLRGTAGRRAVSVRAETAIAGFAPTVFPWYVAMGSSPD